MNSIIWMVFFSLYVWIFLSVPSPICHIIAEKILFKIIIFAHKIIACLLFDIDFPMNPSKYLLMPLTFEKKTRRTAQYNQYLPFIAIINTHKHPTINQCCCCFIFIHFLVYDVRIQEIRKGKKMFLFSNASVWVCFWLLFRLFAIQFLMISIHKNRYLLFIGVCTNEWHTHSQYSTI